MPIRMSALILSAFRRRELPAGVECTRNQEAPQMAAQNAELSRRIFEDVWNRKNLSTVDELMSADYVHHDASSPAVPSGVDGYKQFVNSYMTAFPDAHFTIDDVFTYGLNTEVQNEVTRWTVVGTHEGELAGIPRTGRRFSVTGISIARIV